MKRLYVKLGGVFLFMMGLFFVVNSPIVITGNVVLDEIGNNISSILGFVFLVVGLIFVTISYGNDKTLEGLAKGKMEMLTKEGRALKRLERELGSGRMGTYKELAKLARKAGYEIEHGSNHDKVISPEGEVVMNKQTGHPVTIPRDNKAKKGTYRKILTDIIADSRERYWDEKRV